MSRSATLRTSDSGARLMRTRLPRQASSAVLVLHGGASRGGSMMVSPTQLSVLRMIPLARQLARRGPSSTAVLRLLNSRRGWDTEYTPVADVRWALDQVADLVGDHPVVLVGHSLGGRAALMSGHHPAVRGVAALNPWVYAHDDPPMRGRKVLIAHGARDRIASPQRAATVARRLATTNDVDHVEVEGAHHAMLRHASDFNRLSASFVREVLGG